jgi:serine/threonine protein kinase
MTDSTPLTDLLRRWRELREGGQEPSPEDLCRDCPDMLPALRRELQILSEPDDPSRYEPAASSIPANAGATLADSGPSAAVRRDWPSLPGYEILGELGRGGMGIVYRARDRKRNRIVALKTLQGMTRDSLYLFKHEFRVLANVAHPNLIPLYELISDGRQWCFTMELVEGVNLLTYIRHGGPPAQPEPAAEQKPPLSTPAQEQRLRSTMIQLAEGLEALHAAGRLHRDIKPSNAMVTEKGRVLILDFGLAAEVGEGGVYANPGKSLLGTIAYMSPEQAAGQPLSAATDWYSVGVILYEALVGARPFTGDIPTILQGKQYLDPLPPSRVLEQWFASQVGTTAPAAGISEELNTLCMNLLARDPARRPSGAEVLRRLRGSTEQDPSASRHFRATALFGRERHLEALQDAFRTLRQGHTVLVYLAGRSGMGKSALISRFLERLKAKTSAVILVGQCYEKELVPYKAFDSLMDNLGQYLDRLGQQTLEAVSPPDARALVRVFPTLNRLSDVPGYCAPTDIPDLQEVRRRAFVALRELLNRLGRRQPLVLVVDDLQWGDLDSMSLFIDLLKPPNPPPLLFLGAYRQEEVDASPFLQGVFASRELAGEAIDSRRLAVKPLTDPEAVELARSLLEAEGLSQPDLVEGIAREAGGNPLFVSELAEYVRAAAERGEQASEGALLGAGSLSLPSVLWARVQRLPVHTRHLLEVLAVAGRPLLQTDAAQAAGLADDERAAVASLRAHRLVRTTGFADGEEIATYHDRVRETVAAHLSPERLRDCHRSLAVMLEASGRAEPEALAFHFQGANQLDQARKYLVLAAEKAVAALAFDRAAQFYQTALDMDPKGPHNPRDRDQRARWERQLGEVFYQVGNLPESTRHLHQALALRGQPEPTATSGLVLGTLKQVLSHAVRRLGLARSAARHGAQQRPGGEADPLEEAGLAYERLSNISYFNCELLQGLHRALNAMNLAERVGASALLARSYAGMCIASSLMGVDPLARLYARLAEPLARSANHPATLIQVLIILGVVHLGQGRWELVRQIGDESVAVSERAGSLRQLADSVTLHAMLANFLAQFEEAKEHYVRVLSVGQQSCNVMQQAWGLNGMGESLFRQGKHLEACDMLQEAAALLHEKHDHTEELRIQGMLAAIYWRRGLPELTEQAVGALEQVLKKSPSMTCSTLEGFAGLAEVQLGRWEQESRSGRGAGNSDPARKACALLWRHARVFPIGRPRALRYEGLADFLSGRPRRAHKAWQRSLKEAQQLGLVMEAGFAHYEIGRHLPGDPAGRKHLTEAVRIFAELGMAHDEKLGRDELGRS